MKRFFLVFVLGALISPAHSALLGRAPSTSGGTDYQAYYDDVLEITWLADANLAHSLTFGLSGIDANNGRFIGGTSTVTQWLGLLNDQGHLGLSTWKLPVIQPYGASVLPHGVFSNDGSTHHGWNITSEDSELAYMFYVNLGNQVGCTGTIGTNCVDNDFNSGSFSNIQFGSYFYETRSQLHDWLWSFDFDEGSQDAAHPLGYAWIVTEGDPLAAVPIPAAAWLFASALGLLGWTRIPTR